MMLHRNLGCCIRRGARIAILLLGTNHLLRGQAAVADSTASQTPTPLVTADFVEPMTPVNWRAYQTPQACLSMMERSLKTAIFDDATALARTDSVHIARSYNDNPRTPLPSSVVAAGQDCVRHLPVSVQDLPVFQLSAMLRVTIGINNDSLIQAVVTRQLALAGPSARARAQVLENVVHRLTTNAWIGEDRDANHLTVSNVQLAHQYAEQLYALDRPETVVYSLRTWEWLHRSARRDDTLVDFDEQLKDHRESLQLGQRWPLNALPPSDQHEVDMDVQWDIMEVARLTYVTSLNHADLTRWLHTRDSVRKALGNYDVVRPDSLVGTPAAQITGEYWFNTSTPTPVVPAQGQVSLIVFDNPDGDVTQRVSPRKFGELRRLHTLFPKLQIVLVATTQGSFRGTYLIMQPDSEAALIHHYFDELQVPGILCVSKSTYRTVVGGEAIPLGTPVLNAYKLDPRAYSDRVFLVDTQGWVVSQDFPSGPEDEAFIQRLLTRTITQSGGIHRRTPSGDTVASPPQPPDSVALPARRTPTRLWPWPTDELFHGITLTIPQQDSIQLLIVDQKARAEEVMRVRRTQERPISSPAGIDTSVVKAIRTQDAAIRNSNRAQFRAVLTPDQQRQFDHNVLKVEAEVAKQGVRGNWWW